MDIREALRAPATFTLLEARAKDGEPRQYFTMETIILGPRARRRYTYQQTGITARSHSVPLHHSEAKCPSHRKKPATMLGAKIDLDCYDASCGAGLSAPGSAPCRESRHCLCCAGCWLAEQRRAPRVTNACGLGLLGAEGLQGSGRCLCKHRSGQVWRVHLPGWLAQTRAR